MKKIPDSTVVQQKISLTWSKRIILNFTHRELNLSKSKHTKPKPGDIEEYFGCPPQETCQKTTEANTQHGTMVNNFPMKDHRKSINAVLGNVRMNEGMSTDPVFSLKLPGKAATWLNLHWLRL